MAYGSVKIDSITTSTKTVAIDNLSVNGNINNASIAIDAAIAFSKLQNVSAADRILGRGSSGAGAIEEITCTAAGRALLDDGDAAAQRNTLGLGTLATQNGTFSGTSSGTNTGDQTISLTGDITGSGTGSFAVTIANDAVTYSKIQNVSATDRILGRSTAGSGDVEEITCTAAGRALLDDADAAAQRTTLGLGSLATQNGTFSGASSGTNTGDQTITLTGDVTGSGTGSFAATIANDSVTYAKIQNVSATDKLLGRSSAGSGDIQEITCTAAGRALLDDADAAAQRTTLGLGSLATVNSVSNSEVASNAAIAGSKINPDFGSQNVTTTGSVSDGNGNIRTLPQSSKTSAYTLATGDSGKHISITTGGVTVPSGVFSAGDIVTIFNNSGSNQSIVQGGSVTLRQAGTANTGTRTLAQYGVATVLCVASNTFVISGAGLS